jgi:hypothetical protein
MVLSRAQLAIVHHLGGFKQLFVLDIKSLEWTAGEAIVGFPDSDQTTYDICDL